MTLLALSYLAAITFIVAVAARARRIARMPVHLRWELYPVPHDENSAHGGSVLENPSWWQVKSKPARSRGLVVMAKEILLLAGVREHNRALWLRSYPFHLGLYLLAAFVVLLGVGGIAQGFTGLASSAAVITSVSTVVGIAGFILLGAGAAGLLLRRLGHPALRAHSTGADFFNLACFCTISVLGLVTFALADRDFAYLRAFARALLTVQPPPELPGLVVVEILAGLAVMVYVPLSHMSHFFTKWFTYHSVRWDDRANRVGSSLEATIQRQLGEKVTWAAAHIGAGQGRSWVDIATSEVKK
jgi:nitrate reductase gamma subunit